MFFIMCVRSVTIFDRFLLKLLRILGKENYLQILMIMIIAKIMKQSIKIGRDTSGRITVAFSYNPVYIEKVKAIKGYKWRPKEKHWSFPYSETILEKILSVFDGR